MRRTITLQPSEEYAFDIGRNALILILREATRNVVFKGDSLTPMELSRSDIVHVNEFRNKRMFLSNENAEPITVEFQLSDTLISIREQRMSIDGGVVVDEITKPIVVSEIQAPVDVNIAGAVKVTADNPLSVRDAIYSRSFSAITATVDEDGVTVTTVPTTKDKRYSDFTLQAAFENKGNVILGASGRNWGLSLPPGAAVTIPKGLTTSFSLTPADAELVKDKADKVSVCAVVETNYVVNKARDDEPVFLVEKFKLAGKDE